MGVVRNQGPRKAGRTGFNQNSTQPFQKVVPVLIVIEYLSTFNTPDNNMMQRSRSVYAGFSWHVYRVALKPSIGKQIIQ